MDTQTDQSLLGTYAHVGVVTRQKVLMLRFYPPAIYNGGGGGGAYSITLVRTYVLYVRKMVSGQYLLKTLVYWIHISYTGI